MVLAGIPRIADEKMLVSSPERHGPGLLSHTHRTYRSNIRGDWSYRGGRYTPFLHYNFTLIQSGLTDCGLTIQ